MSFTVVTHNVPHYGLRFKTAAAEEADEKRAYEARKKAKEKGDDPCMAYAESYGSGYGSTMPHSPLWRITPTNDEDKSWGRAESAARVLNSLFKKGEMRVIRTHQRVYALEFRPGGTDGVCMPIDGLWWHEREHADEFCKALNAAYHENGKVKGANLF